MQISFLQLIVGFTLAVLISWLSFKFKVLTLGGSFAATVLGTVVFGLGGLSWTIVLLGFFVSSSGLSKVLKSRKQEVSEKFSKGSYQRCRSGDCKWRYFRTFCITTPVFSSSSMALAGICRCICGG